MTNSRSLEHTFRIWGSIAGILAVIWQFVYFGIGIGWRDVITLHKQPFFFYRFTTEYLDWYGEQLKLNPQWKQLETIVLIVWIVGLVLLLSALASFITRPALKKYFPRRWFYILWFAFFGAQTIFHIAFEFIPHHRFYMDLITPEILSIMIFWQIIRVRRRIRLEQE